MSNANRVDWTASKLRELERLARTACSWYEILDSLKAKFGDIGFTYPGIRTAAKAHNIARPMIEYRIAYRPDKDGQMQTVITKNVDGEEPVPILYVADNNPHVANHMLMLLNAYYRSKRSRPVRNIEYQRVEQLECTE